MRKPLGMRLHTRLWLAAVLAFAIFTLLVSWVVRQTTEPPLRAVIVRDPQGEVIGSGQARYRPADVLPDEVRAPIPGLEHVPYGKFGPGPEFIAQMDDGQILHIHMPRAARSFWTRPPNGFLWSLSLVALAMALATYPITRRLTRRLQALQQGVHAWGQGNLAVRVPEQGQDEVAFLARQFNHTARQIEGLVNSHKSLLANASHELRTPLTRIRMALELMGTQPTPAMRDQIAQSISEVDQLIDEILLASRLDSPEAGLGTPERVDLVGLAAEECSRVAAQVHVLSAPEALQVNGYPRLLRRLMRNLLDNARHYGPTAGELDVELDRTSAEQLVLRINDRGPGIPSQYLDQVFSPFFRLPGSVEGGVGLGLALVRSIATRHQGRVWCENRPDGGARFVVELPIHPASAGV